MHRRAQYIYLLDYIHNLGPWLSHLFLLLRQYYLTCFYTLSTPNLLNILQVFKYQLNEALRVIKVEVMIRVLKCVPVRVCAPVRVPRQHIMRPHKGHPVTVTVEETYRDG